MWLLLSALPMLAALTDALPGRALTFDEALGLAARAPRVTGAQQAAATKRDYDQRISPVPYNPQITVQPGFRLLPRDAREPEVIVDVVQPWNLSGLSSARRKSARTETQTLELEARVTALQQRLGAARAWLDLWAAQRVLDEARREEQIAGEIERLVGKATALQAQTRADLADARAYHAEARLQVIAAEGEVYELGLLLARETAMRVQEPLRAAGDLPDPSVPPVSESARWADRVEHLPEVAALSLRSKAERAHEIEEKAGRGWIAGFGVALQRDSPGGLVVSAVARLQPPIADRGERERGPFAAEAVRLEGEHRQASAQAVAELIMAFHEVDHMREIVETLEGELEPSSREGADLREKIFQAGEATLLEVLQARRIAVSATARGLRARAAHAWAKAKLWLLLASIAEGGR